MLIGIIILFILGFACLIGYGVSCNHEEVFTVLGIICVIGIVILTITGFFTGFISHPATEGTHIGVITAVDLEGIWFRRYEVYLKSSGYTNQSDETKYLIYADEKELAEELQSLIGQKVKLHYGHDGGYIPWNSCGTYHIKSVEKVEEDDL